MQRGAEAGRRAERRRGARRGEDEEGQALTVGRGVCFCLAPLGAERLAGWTGVGEQPGRVEDPGADFSSRSNMQWLVVAFSRPGGGGGGGEGTSLFLAMRMMPIITPCFRGGR